MNIVLVLPAVFPIVKYGGIERVVWSLAKTLAEAGHEVTLLAQKGSQCPFAKILYIEPGKDWNEQIPNTADIVHFHFDPGCEVHRPAVFTIHENAGENTNFSRNTIFVSKNHAERHNAEAFVYNGMDWDEYAIPDLKNARSYFHFLGAARWRVKNLKGAIAVAHKSKQVLHVLGGTRLNFSMGFRFTLSPKIKFHGMVGNDIKSQILNKSRGMIFPVRWNEPFGIALIESLYFGCPVFGTPYGSLPELIVKDVGFLSSDSQKLAEGVMQYEEYDRTRCHAYARDMFNAKEMAKQYLDKYEMVLNGQYLNSTTPKLKLGKVEKTLPWT